MKEQIRLFDYELMDAWFIPISKLTIFDGEQLWVRFSSSNDEMIDNNITIDETAAQKIRDIMNQIAVTKLEELQHCWILDGYIEKFSYFNGDKQIELMGDNIYECQERPELYPNVMAMSQTLTQLGEILIPLGVEKKYFILLPNSQLTT